MRMRKRCGALVALLMLFFACSISMKAQSYTIYPIPQKMTVGTQTLKLTREVNVVAEPGTDPTIVQRMREVLEGAGYAYTEAASLSDTYTNLLVGRAGSGKVADRYASDHGISKGVFQQADNHYDSHLLQLNGNHPAGDILVLGDAEGSAYYAFATLEQLLEQADGTQLREVTFEDFAYVKMRGIVEGFYGHTYSMENRLDLFDYCKRYKMNTYMYGPKSDPYHAGMWRDEYPTSITPEQRFMGLIDQNDVRTLAAKAKECHVDFIWSVHPALQGGGIDFYNLDPGIDQIMAKFDHMHQLGIRHFGVSIDDMAGHPNTQHELADRVQRRLMERYQSAETPADDRVGELIFVPSQYALNFGTHTLSAFKSVQSDVELVFTGYDVFSNIRESALRNIQEFIGRKPVMWWNNPVNDDHDDFLYMHGLTARWTIETQNPIPSMGGLLMNPMNQAQASKICLFGAADYAWNPAEYNEESNWEAALISMLPEETMNRALKEFIRVMSSYSLTGDGEEYAPLYQDLERNFSREQVPQADELLEAMDRAYEACVVLQTMKMSEVAVERLLHEDIEPWLNKVQAMTDIVRRAIRLMQAETDLNDWTVYAQVVQDAVMLHKDPAFFFSALEGSGTETYDTMREAQPAPKVMEGFVRFLAEQITEFMPKLPARNRDFEIVTDQTSSPARIDQGEAVALAGLKGLVLAPGEYVGINFKGIKAVVTEALPEEMLKRISVEWSVSGKVWTAFVPDGIAGQEMVYVRLHNTSAGSYSLPVEQMVMHIAGSDYLQAESVRTNMPTYNGNEVDHIIDGKDDTKFWSNREQQPGDFIEVDYGSVFVFDDIELTFAQGDRPTGKAVVQISNDAMTWTTVSRFAPSEIRKNRYSCKAESRSGRFVRLYLEQTKGYFWFQLVEMKAKGSTLIPVATDNQGNGIDWLDDSSLAIGYTAEGAGHIVYRFIENIRIDEVVVYHNSRFDAAYALPQISVMDGDKWVAAGQLDAACTSVPMQEFATPVMLKIEWNKHNIPSVYEIFAKGEPDMGNGGTGIGETVRASLCEWRLDGRRLRVDASAEISSVRIARLDGALADLCRPASAEFALTLPDRGWWLVEVVTAQGREVRKIWIE